MKSSNMIKCMRGMRFEETRPGRDLCHLRYVRTEKSSTAFVRACEVCVLADMGPAESGLITPAW